MFLTAFAGGQVSKNPVPDAPRPNPPAMNATLLNNPAQDAAEVDSSTALRPLSSSDISLYTVIDLALRNSRAVRIAEAEQQRTQGFASEMRDAYVPNLSVGSGLGYSYGFPLGNPTLFNVSSTSLLFSFSQRDYIRSARAAWKAATLSLKNARQQVILDAALNYIDLNKTMDQIVALNQAMEDTNKLLAVMEDRVNAGLETNMQMRQAQLTRAQIHLKAIQMEDHADDVRQHLAGLTGLAPDAIVPTESSVPRLPDLDFGSKVRQRRGESPAVLASAATADAKMFAAWGDERQKYRPTVGLNFLYSRFSSFNNYSEYYKNFTPNNVGVGIQATWPLFDPIRRDKADESKAVAASARAQAELDRIQSEEGNFSLWRSLRELEAQEEVADLQQQIARDILASTVTQMNHGSADANGPPITPQEADQRRIDERTSYIDLQDAQFNVTKVKLNLLNAVGGLEDWAKENGEATPPDGIPGGSHAAGLRH